MGQTKWILNDQSPRLTAITTRSERKDGEDDWLGEGGGVVFSSSRSPHRVIGQRKKFYSSMCLGTNQDLIQY